MKFSMRALAAGIVVSAIATPAFAQSIPIHPSSAMAPAETRADFAHDQRFQDYLSHHPGVRRKLDRNPDLINDPEFVKKHPELHEFLKRHPNVRNTVENRPEYKAEHAEENADKRVGVPEATEASTANSANSTETTTAKETRAERRAARKEKKAGATAGTSTSPSAITH